MIQQLKNNRWIKYILYTLSIILIAATFIILLAGGILVVLDYIHDGNGELRRRFS